MTVSNEMREQVRQRANFACEFCGVTETDTGGELTIDHFQPVRKGGDDSFENLLSVANDAINTNLIIGPAAPTNPCFGIRAANRLRNISSNWTMAHCIL
jgi:hypothetical protein